MISTIRHNALKALAILGLSAGAVTVPADIAYAQDKQLLNEDDQLLLDIRSGRYRIGDGVRGYQTPNGGVCVDLADMIIGLDLPVRLDKKSRRATGWLFEEDRTITIDREQNIVQIVNKNEKITSDMLYDAPEGWCVDVKAMARWLNVELKPDLTNAILVIESERKLPFELAEERKERAGRIKPKRAALDLSKYPQAEDPYRLFRMPSVDVNASSEIRRDKVTGAGGSLRYELFASGEIAGASFDARLFSNDRAVPESLRLKAYRSDPGGKLLGPLKATHFAIGDVSTPSTALGVQSTAGRGTYITNRPLERSESFDRTNFRGELPDGWDAELYRNDQLIAFSQGTGDGRYEFLDVALLYGQNRFEVVIYGPQGQIRREKKLVPVGIDSIPPKETYYWATIQDSGKDIISLSNDEDEKDQGWRTGFGIERGINAKTSISASYFSSIFDGSRRNYLETSLRRAVGPALAEITAASDLKGGYALRSQALAQFGSTYVSAQAVYLGGGYETERFSNDLHHQFGFSVDHSFKIGSKNIPIRFVGAYRKRKNGSKEIEAVTRSSFNLKRINIANELIWQQRSSSFTGVTTNQLDTAVRLSGSLGGIRLRGEARFGISGLEKGFKNSRLTAEKRLSERSKWRIQTSYDTVTKRAVLGAGITRRFDKFALTGQVDVGSDGSVAAGLNLTFSVGPKVRGGGLRISSSRLASTGQALAIVYHDKNGDGIRQEDEPVEKNVELTAGLRGRGEPTDKNGETYIADLQPFMPVLIGIDSGSLEDPFIQPASSGVVVTPRPGIPFVVELPLVSAGEVAGTLTREDGKILSGVDIELLDERGNVVKTTRSEYDGYFLFESVAYGKYTLRVGALAASIVGVNPKIEKAAILNDDNPTAEVGVIVARHAQKIASAGNSLDKETMNQK